MLGYVFVVCARGVRVWCVRVVCERGLGCLVGMLLFLSLLLGVVFFTALYGCFGGCRLFFICWGWW